MRRACLYSLSPCSESGEASSSFRHVIRSSNAKEGIHVVPVPTFGGILSHMALRKEDFEEAVNGLLCPRHYEYLLFIQNEIEKTWTLDTVGKYRRASEVAKMVHASQPTLPGMSVNDSIHVLKEAIRRLR